MLQIEGCHGFLQKLYSDSFSKRCLGVLAGFQFVEFASAGIPDPQELNQLVGLASLAS